MMQSKLLSLLVTISATILVSGMIQNNAMAYSNPQQEQGYSHHDMMMQPGVYAFGNIASLQTDENGNLGWIASGIWEGSVSMDNKTQSGGGNQTIGSSTTANATATTMNLPNATFSSKFNVVRTNGSDLHDHEIYNFRLTSMSNPNNMTSEFNGTATIALNEGPVENVPVSIKRIDNNVISIWADPIKINNHFGSIPTFGTIEKLVKVEK